MTNGYPVLIPLNIFLLLDLVVLLRVFSHSGKKTATMKLFQLFAVTVCIAQLISCYTYAQDYGQVHLSDVTLHIMYTLLTTGMTAASYIWFLYNHSLLPNLHARTRPWRLFYAMPVFLLFVCSASSYWTHWVYNIDQDGVYHPGTAFFLQTVGPYFYTIVAFVVLCIQLHRNASARTWRMFRVFFLFAIPTVLGACIQIYMYRGGYSQICMSITMMLLYMELYLEEMAESKHISALTEAKEEAEFANEHLTKLAEQQQDQLAKIQDLYLELNQEKRIQDHFHEIISNSGSGIWIIRSKEGESLTMEADDQMKKLLGLDPNQEYTPKEIYDFWYSRITPGAIASVQASVGKMLQERLDENTYLWTHPTRGDIYVRCGGRGHKQPDGSFVLSGYHADVTDIILKEKKANIQLQYQMQVISSMSQIYFAAYFLDLEKGTYSELHSQEALRDIAGREGSLPDARKFISQRMVLPEYTAEMFEFLNFDTLDERMGDKTYITMKYQGKNWGWCQVALIAAGRDENGHLKAAIFASRSIKEEKELEAKQQAIIEEARDAAEAANAAKTSFLFSMSHDIRTPMNAIIGFTDLLRKNQEDAEKRADYLNKIDGSSRILLSIINNVLEMARIEKGTIELEETPNNVMQFIDSICAPFEVICSNKGVHFKWKSRLVHEHLIGDPTKLIEVFGNILNNAYKYTPKGGTIDASVEELPCEDSETTLMRVVISDTGIGMSPEFLPTLFDEFTREKTSTESRVEGTGLGMSIVKRLVELMNGTIEVQSQKGLGTTFIVTIPLKITDSSYITNKAGSGDVDRSKFKGKRILLAEDNDLNAEITVTILENEGFVVERANDGARCVEMLHQSEPHYYDLILMDIQMPVMNGFEATRIIRQFADKAKANIPIVALTANAFEEDRRKALAAGLNGHLAKPINIDELMQKLAILI